jgi:hypothetical protein
MKDELVIGFAVTFRLFCHGLFLSGSGIVIGPRFAAVGQLRFPVHYCSGLRRAKAG